jgi:hypothetical protein
MSAAHPIVTVDHGVVRIPVELRSDPRFQDGARVELVPVVLEHAEEQGAQDWRTLEGILAGVNFDTTEWKLEERELELAHDERKSGIPRPTW